MTAVKMHVDDWLEHYKPFANHLDEYAGWQGHTEDGRGIMFETYGAELEFVLGCNPACVWTYRDSDSGDSSILVSGLHAFELGVIGYFVTQVPVAEGLTYQVFLD